MEKESLVAVGALLGGVLAAGASAVAAQARTIAGAVRPAESDFETKAKMSDYSSAMKAISVKLGTEILKLK